MEAILSTGTGVTTGFGFEQAGEGKTNDWLTPPKLIERLGHFDLDPCGCVGMPWRLADKVYFQSEEMLDAERRVQAAKEAEDKVAQKIAERDYEEAVVRTSHGLNLAWTGRVFCNPPYGPYVGEWARRMAEHGNGIFLIFSRTETEAWQESIWPFCDAVFFPYGRMCFYRPDGTRAKSGTAPSAIIAYGQNNIEAIRNSGLAGALVLPEVLRGEKVSRL